MVVFDDATGNLQGNNVTANRFLVNQGLPGSSKGYSFVNETGFDTGMFSDGDGALYLYSNNQQVVNVTSSGVQSTGYVQFGSLTSTQRSGLSPVNGMVIYNSTANRFQGYQNGAWINLDDGTAAP